MKESSRVFLVCGSPGSGKSAYVAQNKTQRDLVVDLDYLCAALTGDLDDIYFDHSSILSVAIEIRDALYSIIEKRRGKWDRAFVVTAAANMDELNALARRLNAAMVIIDTPLDECIERIRRDKRRARISARFEALAEDWWRGYNRSRTRDPTGDYRPDNKKTRIVEE